MAGADWERAAGGESGRARAARAPTATDGDGDGMTGRPRSRCARGGGSSTAWLEEPVQHCAARALFQREPVRGRTWPRICATCPRRTRGGRPRRGKGGARPARPRSGRARRRRERRSSASARRRAVRASMDGDVELGAVARRERGSARGRARRGAAPTLGRAAPRTCAIARAARSRRGGARCRPTTWGTVLTATSSPAGATARSKRASFLDWIKTYASNTARKTT